MESATSYKWLLLIHQIPPNPNAFRVRIWRRLQQIGAVSIKQSVYAMPLSKESKEDLGWILKEIMDNGGEGSILEARFIEGLADEQIVALFQNARKTDYEKIISEAGALVSEIDNLFSDEQVLQKKMTAALRLDRRFKETIAIDFFNAPERGTAEILLKELSNMINGTKRTPIRSETNLDLLKGKTWVTRKNIFVDRMACCWLIRRFIDSNAKFLFVADDDQVSRPDHVRFDMHGGEYTHQGDKCSFEIMAEIFRSDDKALSLLSQVVHDIDLKETRFGHSETDGVKAMLTGIAACEGDDVERMDKSMAIFEHMHAYFHRQLNQ